MNKISKFLVNCIRSISGMFLLGVVILVWIIGIVFKAIVEIITWLEIKTTDLMKKAFGDDINELK
tara:strand:- start:1677 stop:1871 length:195 start_codon:yes stop_codon:yes gene_type:complete